MAPTELGKVVGKGFRDPQKITSAVRRRVMKRRGYDDYAVRGVGAIHPSEASKTDWCPRSTYYRISGAPAEPIPAPLALQMVWEIGSDSGLKWQNWFWEMGILRGHFFCRWCGLYFEGTSPKECPRCETTGLLE